MDVKELPADCYETVEGPRVISPAKVLAHILALRAELASVKADAWRAATVLAHNICIQESDRINAEDGSIEAMDAISECAKRIREWAEPSPEQLNDMLGESRAAHPKDAP